SYDLRETWERTRFSHGQPECRRDDVDHGSARPDRKKTLSTPSYRGASSRPRSVTDVRVDDGAVEAAEVETRSPRGLGEEGCLRHSGGDVHLEELHDSVGIEDDVGAREVTKAERLVCADGDRAHDREHVLVEPRGGEVLGPTRVVPGVEVVGSARDDLDRGEGLRAVAEVHDAHRE